MIWDIQNKILMMLHKICCCCGGCSLQKESLVIGFINLVLSISALVGFRPAMDKIVHSQLYRTKLYLTEENSFPMLIFFYLPCVHSAISSVVLIIGAAKSSKNWLLPWIIGAFLWLLMATTFFFIMIKITYDLGGEAMIVFLILFLLGIVIYTYMLLVVIGYFDELKEYETNSKNKVAWPSVRRNIFSVPAATT